MLGASAGVTFRLLGHFTGQTLLGARVVASMLMFATVSGILMALFLNNAGGAWDNAKKYVETGAFGGKGSEAHKASITGDTCVARAPWFLVCLVEAGVESGVSFDAFFSCWVRRIFARAYGCSVASA